MRISKGFWDMTCGFNRLIMECRLGIYTTVIRGKDAGFFAVMSTLSHLELSIPERSSDKIQRYQVMARRRPLRIAREPSPSLLLDISSTYTPDVHCKPTPEPERPSSPREIQANGADNNHERTRYADS